MMFGVTHALRSKRALEKLEQRVERIKEAAEYAIWFAWYPVKLEDGRWLWLDYARWHYDYDEWNGRITQHRFPTYHQCPPYLRPTNEKPKA